MYNYFNAYKVLFVSTVKQKELEISHSGCMHDHYNSNNAKLLESYIPLAFRCESLTRYSLLLPRYLSYSLFSNHTCGMSLRIRRSGDSLIMSRRTRHHHLSVSYKHLTKIYTRV